MAAAGKEPVGQERRAVHCIVAGHIAEAAAG